MVNIYLILYFKVLIEILLAYSLLVAVTLFFASHLINQNLKSFQEQTASIDREYQKINSQIADINQKLNNLNLIQKKRANWSEYLHNLFSIEPKGIALKTMDWNSGQNILIIQGRAQTRDDFLAYRQALEKLSFIKKLEVPISALTVKENISFDIKAELK